jgi:hypothetical protein
MKKKLLFIAPGYYGFNEVVFDGLAKYSGYEVIHINSTGSYQYKNVWERIYNFFLKTFIGRNIKHTKKKEYINFIINSSQYDLLLINRPDVLSDEDIQLAIKKSKFSIVLFWDSIEKIPAQKNYINKFNICCSFDSDDCKTYNLDYITNFYFVKEYHKMTKYDISYLATYDHRMPETIQLFNYFLKNNIVAKAKIFTYKSKPIKEKLPDTIKVINQTIPFADSYKYYLDSKIILDIAHPHQKGLSFRPYEAIGLNKKLITTNEEIVKYDFYDPNNILVINDLNNFSIPQSFIDSEYIKPNEFIKEKYYIKTWINTILSFYEN